MHTHFWLNVRPSVLFFINLKKQKKNLITFEYRIAQTEQIKRAPQRSWHIFKTYDNHLSPWPQDRANYNTVGKKPTRTRQKVNNQTKNTIYTVAERYNKHVELLQGNCWSKIQIQKRLEKGILLLSEVVRESYFGLDFVGDTFSSGNAFLFLERFLLDADLFQEHALDLPYKRRELEENALL